MQILRRTPWSRIRLQNSVDKEFLEIVGNGKQTCSVLKETIAVSVTMSINVENVHHQIRLRDLSCSRMREKRREPEVPEARVPVVECFDCLARISSKELASTHSVKSGASRMLVLQVGEWMQIWGESALEPVRSPKITSGRDQELLHEQLLKQNWDLREALAKSLN